MLKLAQLVKRYADNEIDYSTFRREFVMQFLSVRNNDVAIADVVAMIESLCADVAEKLIVSEADLREQLTAAVASMTPSLNSGSNPVQFLDVPAQNGNRSRYIASGATSIGANVNAPSFA
jgi:hypothetical protein